ncbi:hypothetical protein [Rhodocaloribacter sp.]
MHPFFKLRLAEMPMPAKLLLTAVLMTLGTGYLFALSNVALKVGFFPDEVARHYYGNEASRRAMEALEQEPAPATDGGVAEEEAFSFDELDAEAGISDEPIVPVPTLEALIAEGHFHLFGYTSIFFLCGLVLLFAEVTPWLKNTLIVAPFAASVLDIWSMLLTRFVGPGFSWMLMISGFVMAASFLSVFVIGIHQLWFRKQPVSA